MGGADNDDLFGNANDDRLLGNVGDDALNGGPGGADYCNGGTQVDGDTATGCETVSSVP